MGHRNVDLPIKNGDFPVRNLLANDPPLDTGVVGFQGFQTRTPV